MSSQQITLRNVKKYYKLGETVVKALDDISFSINRGEFVIIIGVSGSGKSTLVNLIGGVDTPDSGEIVVFGKHIEKMTTSELTRYRREKVGFVFQFYSLVPTLTALENIEMAAELIKMGKRELKDRCFSVLNAVGLENRAKSYPSQLSGGERQRISLARAIAKHPEILVVDEPTGQLDAETGEEMVRLIRDISKNVGSTVIMVTHDTSFLKLADRVIKLSSGRIVEQ